MTWLLFLAGLAMIAGGAAAAASCSMADGLLQGMAGLLFMLVSVAQILEDTG